LTSSVFLCAKYKRRKARRKEGRKKGQIINNLIFGRFRRTKSGEKPLKSRQAADQELPEKRSRLVNQEIKICFKSERGKEEGAKREIPQYLGKMINLQAVSRRSSIMLVGKKIIIGITGSIAAYKAAYLIRALIKKGAEVQVVITPAGKEFITPVTLSALTGKPVVSEFFTANDGSWHSHVDLGLWADLMVIAPATASTIGKMANGIADNMLITTYLSMKAPVFIAPAMDLDMFAHPSTQQNLERLKSYGNYIIEPASGFLASKLEGKGRMEEPDVIATKIEDFLTKQSELSKKKVLITAGPTYENIDSVRYISNYSSGKMGFALAEECAKRGAEVTLITGPVQLSATHPSIQRIDVISADEMYEEAVKHFKDSDIAILCAAVADYKPKYASDRKIKRKEETLLLELTANKDIAAALGAMKKEHQYVTGFALETENEEFNAKEKLKKKNLDAIVLNSLRDKGAGFRTDTNKISIIKSDEPKKDFPLKSKSEVAGDIVDFIYNEIKLKNDL